MTGNRPLADVLLNSAQRCGSDSEASRDASKCVVDVWGGWAGGPEIVFCVYPRCMSHSEEFTHLFVEGEPYPQGSKTAFLIGGKCRMIESKGKGTTKHKNWRKKVNDAAIEHAAKSALKPLDGPVRAEVIFYMPKPPSRPKKNWLVYVKPDLDKLCRSVFDSITGVLVVDDSRICELTTRKEYAIDRPGGVSVRLWALEESDGGNPAPRPLRRSGGF